MLSADNQIIALVFIGVAALALVLQTIFLMVLAATVGKASRSALEHVESMRSSVMPIVYNTREVINRLSPKIEEAADELTALTKSLRAQTADVQMAADEVIGRARRTAARLDSMASTVLDSVERAAGFMTETVARPVRQITGVVASVRAIMDALRAVEGSSRPYQAAHNPVETRASEMRSSEARSSEAHSGDFRATEARATDPRSNEPRPTEKDMFV